MNESEFKVLIGKVAILASHLEPGRRRITALNESVIGKEEWVVAQFFWALATYVKGDLSSEFEVSVDENSITVTRR